MPRKGKLNEKQRLRNNELARARWARKQFTPEERAMAAEKARSWGAANRDRSRLKAKEYYHNNIVEQRKKRKEAYARNPEDSKIRSALWAKNNPERCRERSRKIREKNPERERNRIKKWKADNPDRTKELGVVHAARRRARLLGLSEHHTNEEWRAILAAHDGKCKYCGSHGKKGNPITRDHFVALARGGSNAASNIVPACKLCNSKKGTRDGKAFMEEINMA
jgi:5-methylcytosine-specific restriction endonuclease McrA